MNSNSNQLIKDTERELFATLSEKSAEISRYSQDLVDSSIKEKEKAQKRLSEFYNRNKYLTIFLAANSIITVGLIIFILVRGNI